MAIKVNGTEVIDNSLGLKNIASVDATTVTTLQDAGIGGGVEVVALSGTTPSLNYDNGNVFTHTPTAATTFTFTGTDTAAKFNLIITEAEGYSLSSVSYVQEFSISAQEANVTGLFFKPDGTKMYIIGLSGVDVNEYNLKTAWDISTASYVQAFSVSIRESSPTGLFFKPDGTKMYVCGYGGDEINEFNLSTAWDVSSAVFANDFSVSSQEGQVHGVFFKPDGTKMYITGGAGVEVNEYNLSTPWDIGSASYVQNFSVSGQDSAPQDLTFKPDGTKMFIVGDAGNDINEYSLSTPWDISSASYVQNFSVSSQGTNPHAMYISSGGGRMYTVDNDDKVFQYNMGEVYSLTFPTSVQLPTINRLVGTKTALEFITTDSGSTYQCINATGGII